MSKNQIADCLEGIARQIIAHATKIRSNDFSSVSLLTDIAQLLRTLVIACPHV